MEWNGMKRIILEYSSLPFFESFNGGNGTTKKGVFRLRFFGPRL